ncbi:MAG: hypothetical protein QME74_02390, partial [Candidatus Edwardsbacteria bacterium]|nr:hypothetical protein [Candidatus Edwardsbacteria bacterium]
QTVKFLKIDTDGFDFRIILHNRPLIKKVRPHLYFEYDVMFGERDKNDSLKVVTFLVSMGYCFVLYDNCGNLMGLLETNAIKAFGNLNHYLISSRKNGGGVCYVDVFATIDKKIARKIVRKDRDAT